MDVTSCDCDGFDAAFMASVGDVHGVFGKNDRVIVGESDRFAGQPLGFLCNHFRGRGRGKRIHLPRLGNIPVLAKVQDKLQPAVPKDRTLLPG